MKEDFLHFVWKYGYFSIHNLQTTDGQEIVIKSKGIHNHSNGPDFSNASLLIDGIEWLGHVEIHINSSDWLLHKHQYDKNYDNVILHVVWKEDKTITNSSGIKIPCLCLEDRVDPSLLQKHQSLILQKSWIACENQLTNIDTSKVSLWLQALAMDKLEIRAREILTLAKKLNYHWEQLFMIYLFRAFGLRQNKEAFDALVEKLPIEILNKYQHSTLKLEALLFGVAGFLHSAKQKSIYLDDLHKEYQFLKHKHQFQEIPMTYWKFGRIRPANFPTIRIAQLCNYLHQYPRAFQFLLEEDQQTIINQLQTISTSEFWDTHYQFGQSSTFRKKIIGKSTIQLILINAIVPVLFSYGKYKNDDHITNKAVDIFESIPSESNSIIKKWKTAGVNSKHALQSQALLYLKKEYCDQYRCTSCQIGHQILSKK